MGSDKGALLIASLREMMSEFVLGPIVIDGKISADKLLRPR
jgi:hypothetical protein